ncbi:uncharacterized protein BJ212DRAFT_1304382 [Suillus subaureus]|uniref:Uncharacterized protein n=1 Tax=Suillus subaureus TaxID=48587 RepID=A0A9P7DW18_9AGAM|nr:uncharacterized protein BJ212DRAFT_1304382 [Suillus subaureus]KAG1804268.1 hypothetical protein BJ212DRAFT_1304382 [Suillus subaureus]
MVCITSDPALDIAPDFVSATFQGIRDRIIGNMQATHEEVANELTTAWNTQVNEETHLAAEAAHTKQECCKQEQLLLEQEVENECHEVKKKPMINNFKTGALVSDTLTHWPSQYAIHKLKSVKYIKLWYFSPDECREAANEVKSSADSTFGFTKVDNFITLKTIASFRPSHKVIQDHGLEWHQFNMAKNSFLVYINKLNWPEKHQHALTMFFMNIISNPQQAELFGEHTLLLYAVRV